MSMLAIVRPSDWEPAVFVHVVGALLLVGSLVTALALAGTGSSSRLTFRALLWAAVPAFILMRGSAEWAHSVEDISSSDPPAWIDIGYIISDPVLLLLIASTIVAGIGSRRGNATSRWVTGLVGVMVVATLVAVWAMTTKPT